MRSLSRFETTAASSSSSVRTGTLSANPADLCTTATDVLLEDVERDASLVMTPEGTGAEAMGMILLLTWVFRVCTEAAGPFVRVEAVLLCFELEAK